MNKSYPFEIVDVDPEKCKPVPRILVGPKKICLLSTFKHEVLPKLYNIEVKKDDVWLFGFLRSGTTLAQEMIWLIANDLNYEKAAQNLLDIRFRFFERSGCAFNTEVLENQMENENKKEFIDNWTRPTWEVLTEENGQNFTKTHIPLSLANPDLLTKNGCKIVYIARNVKDVCVSLYHYVRAVSFSTSTAENFDKFFDDFRNDMYGSYFTSVKEGWQLRNHKNVLFMFYEDYTKDLRKTIKTVADFLGKSLSEEDIRKLEDHLQIDNFRKNKSVNNDHFRDLNLMEDKDNQFIRTGKVGGWRDYFTGKLNEEADKWIAENLKDTDLKFPES